VFCINVCIKGTWNNDTLLKGTSSVEQLLAKSPFVDSAPCRSDDVIGDGTLIENEGPFGPL